MPGRLWAEPLRKPASPPVELVTTAIWKDRSIPGMEGPSVDTYREPGQMPLSCIRAHKSAVRQE